MELDEKYRDRGLQILGFPCNQFGKQESGTNEEIMKFVERFNVQFPLFEKANVNGSQTRPVFAYLKAQLSGMFGDFIKWNFTKFVCNREGHPVARHGPKESPLSFEAELVKLLDQN